LINHLLRGQGLGLGLVIFLFFFSLFGFVQTIVNAQEKRKKNQKDLEPPFNKRTKEKKKDFLLFERLTTKKKERREAFMQS